MTFGDKLSGLFGRKRRQELGASALEPDRLRDALVRETEPDVPRFGQMLQEGVENRQLDGERWHQFPELARDVARAAVSYDDPKVRRREDMLPSHALNREILFQMLGTTEMEEVRRHSIGDAEDALFSTLTLKEAIAQHADELGEHVDRSNSALEHEETLEASEQALEELREQSKAFKDANQPIPQEHVAEIKDRIDVRERAKAELAEIDQKNSESGMIAVAVEVAKSAAGAAAELAGVLGQLAGLAPGMEGSKDPSERLRLASEWATNGRLRRILDEAGRLARVLKFARQERSRNVPIQPVGITTGREISRLVPQELAAAHSPALRGLWAKRYGERSLLEYRMDGKEPANKGPVITVKDGSGSMALGNRSEHATAVELAMLNMAAREKRAFACVEFGGPRQARSKTFPAGKVDGAEVLKWAGQFYRSAGTDIKAGLWQALTIVNNESVFKTADIILMTDGQCAFGEEDQHVVESLRELGVKIHGISIAAPDNRYLKQACDWHVELADMADMTETTQQLGASIT